MMNGKNETGTEGCIDEAIFDNAHIMMVVMDKNGTISMWNRAAETMTGYGKAEVIGSAEIWKNVYPDPGYRHEVTHRIKEILAKRDYFENFETSIITKAGDTRVIAWNTREMKEGGNVRIVSVGVDITKQHEAERKVRDMNSFNEGIIENAHILISVLDQKGNVLIWNRAAEDITGYSRNDVVGKNTVWKSMYPDPAYRKEITKKITSIISSQMYFENLETTIVTKIGEQRIIAWNTREIGNGIWQHEIAIGRDITDQRKAERALVSYISEIAMRLKNPVEILRDNLAELARMTRNGTLTFDEIAVTLDGQVRSTAQVAANVAEFQKAVAEKNEEIPEAYRKFLSG
ncbi:MAG: PAS domain S-box protein [Methanoregula sp.]|nr:PAS domain S-box protein [Methanoregula sp.]